MKNQYPDGTMQGKWEEGDTEESQKKIYIIGILAYW